MKWFHILLLLFIVAIPTSAQTTGLILGTIQDHETSRPLTEASIRIMDTSINREFTTVTDREGRFAYLGLMPGAYIVTVTKDGYAAVDVFDVIIDRGEQTRLKLTLTPSHRTTLKRQLIRYQRPLINMQDASIKHVFRMAF